MTQAERESLILTHMYLVTLIARHVYWKYGKRYDLDDLTSTGTLGLIDAVDRYDPSNGVELKAYANYRIRGSMLDYILSCSVVHSRAHEVHCEALSNGHLSHPNCRYAPGLDDAVLDSERRRGVNVAVERSGIKRRDREILRLTAAGLSNRKIAPVLGMSQTGVLLARRSAIEKIRGQLRVHVA